MVISDEDFQAFNQYNAQLSTISSQKTQLKLLVESTKSAIEELKQSKEESAYKNLGFIMLKVEKNKLVKDLENEMETLNIRIKTLEKSEDLISKKIQELQAKFNAELATKEKK